jgi:NADP-dependent 3-hydroxy acid dehydrogenase YdfG
MAEKLNQTHPLGSAIYRAVDIADHAAVDSAIASAIAETGEIDVLINNVGSRRPVPVGQAHC